MDPAFALEEEELKKEKVERNFLRANVIRKMGRKKSSAVVKDVKVKDVKKANSGLQKAASSRNTAMDLQKQKTKDGRLKAREERKAEMAKERERKRDERAKRREEREKIKRPEKGGTDLKENKALKRAERDVQAARELAGHRKQKIALIRQQSSKQVIERKVSKNEDRKIKGKLRKEKTEEEVRYENDYVT